MEKEEQMGKRGWMRRGKKIRCTLSPSSAATSSVRILSMKPRYLTLRDLFLFLSFPPPSRGNLRDPIKRFS